MSDAGTKNAFDPHLNAAQVQAIEKKLREHIEMRVKDIGLRQWAVEQVLTHANRHADFTDLVKMFESVYAFVAKPAGEYVNLTAQDARTSL